MVDTPTPERTLTPKERAELLRQHARERGAQGPRVKRVTVEQVQSPVPPGVRFDIAIDSRAQGYGVNITFDSRDAARGWLETLRWACNQVGVDFDVKDFDSAKAQKPARLL